MSNDILPQSRSDWARLDWKQAQSHVAKLLNYNGYTKIEEMSLSNHKRSDVFVFRQIQDSIIFGIIEVKCYNKISRSIENKAMIQAIGYLNEIYQSVDTNPRWGNIRRTYFCGVVYTKDYPVIDNHDLQNYLDYIPKELSMNNQPILIATTPNSLIDRLNLHFPKFHKQSSLDEFW